LIKTLAQIDSTIPGYASEMISRLAGIEGTGEGKYESMLQILAEIYVTQGVVESADKKDGVIQVVHEPGTRGKKNPECEALIAGRWCAIEVKTPKLIAHGRMRSINPWQMNVRMPAHLTRDREVTLPRDNPVKDFLCSAEEKFEDYEHFRPGAIRLLAIVWDDYCNEPIAALKSPISGLLTSNSFHRDESGVAVKYSHIDGVAVIRHQHQIIRATREEPLLNGVTDAMKYRNDNFPFKAFIPVPGGRMVPEAVLDALNLVPLADCLGAEYQPSEMIMWVDLNDPSSQSGDGNITPT
jgi:hypothetical protein